MIILSKEELSNLTSLRKVIGSVEKAFSIYKEENYYMPERMHVDYEGNTLLLMPCFAEGAFGVKLVSLFPENSRKGEPVIQGIMIINDPETGSPIGILEASCLTALRTGAVGAVAVKNLSEEGLKVAGVVGLGVQGFYQSLFLTEVRDVERLYIYDKDVEKIEKFQKKFSEERKVTDIVKCGNTEELVENSEVVITATSSPSPVLPDKTGLYGGKTFIGIGSYKPNMREYPEAFFRTVEAVYVDTEQATHETGDILDPLEEGWIEESQISPASDFVVGSKSPTQGKTILFKSVGMALFDLVVGNMVYKVAKEKDRGAYIEF